MEIFPYSLGSYIFHAVKETPRLYNTRVQEFSTLSSKNEIENVVSRRVQFVLIDNTQDVTDILFLKLMMRVPQIYELKSSTGTFNVVLDEIKFFRRDQSWRVEIRAVEAERVDIIRSVMEGETFRLEDELINVEAERSFSSRAGTLSVTIANKNDALAYFVDTAQYVDLFQGYNFELDHFGSYYTLKLYHTLSQSGNTIRFEGFSSASQILNDVIYINDETWLSTTTIYELITAAASYSILDNTGISDAGVSTLLQTRYLTTDRNIAAGITKLEALNLLIEYILQDLNEEWLGYTSDTENVLFVQPARQDLEITHELEKEVNILNAYSSSSASDKNWIAGYGDVLDNIPLTEVEDVKADATYTRKHNSSCLPDYDQIWTVATDATDVSVGVLATWDEENGYIEQYRDIDHEYNCCFALTEYDILIGSDTHILVLDREFVFTEGPSHLLPTTIISKPVTQNDYIAYITETQFVFSNDAGDTWTAKSTPTGEALQLSGEPSRYWLLVTDAGTLKVYYTTDYGDSWIFNRTIGITVGGGGSILDFQYDLCATISQVRVFYLENGIIPYKAKIQYSNDFGNSWNTATIDSSVTTDYAFVECRIVDNYTYAFYNETKLMFSRSATGASWSTPVELNALPQGPTTWAEGERIIVFFINAENVQFVAYSENEGDSWNYPDPTDFDILRFPGTVPPFYIGLYWITEGFEYETGIAYSLGGEEWSIGFTTEEWTFGFYYGTSYDEYLDVLYRSRENENCYHRRYFLQSPLEIQEISNVIAFEKLGVRVFALASDSKLYYNDTPLSDTWTLAKTFGTNGVDLITDGEHLFVMYDDKVDYASSTIDEFSTWTNLLDNSTVNFTCFGRTCNVIYIADENANLWSFSDISFLKLEITSDHGISDPIYDITDVMGDVFVSYNNGDVERLYLTLQGDDTDWQNELLDLSLYPFYEVSKVAQNYIVLLGNSHFFVGKVKSPSESNRLRSVARDLTDINDRGKISDAIISSGFGTYIPSALCAEAYAELLNRSSVRINYNITTFGSVDFYINEICSVNWAPYSGSVEIRKVQTVMSNNVGWVTNLDLGERFPTFAEVLDNWFGR
jgi:hypothetical protein